MTGSGGQFDRLLHNFRCWLGETHFYWAIKAMPEGSAEQLGMIMAFMAYKRTLALKAAGWNDATTTNMVSSGSATNGEADNAARGK